MNAILLDAGPLGMISNPRSSPEALACMQWVEGQVRQGNRILVPEIVDYEIRRELLRAQKTRGIERLDTLEEALEYLPLTTRAMKQAAVLWAEMRRAGTPTARDSALDGDVILAGQAHTLGLPESEVVIATANVGHLARLAPARHWREIH